jgi:hypothetical protein
MPKAGHGRGAIAAIGLILLFAGVVGGAVLWVLADREPNKAAESFARAAPGCTTTLTFGEPGEFFVYEELSGVTQAVEGCQPSTLPGRAFTFTVTTANGTEVPRVEDTSMSYDLDVGAATSVARITIEEAGEYRINVLGDDPAIVAAVGGDPEADVEQLRRGAIVAAVGGVVLGLLLLWLAGRRSKRAATFAGPLDPGWGVTERDHARRAAAAVDDGTTWPPATTQVPVNPHAPDERRVARIERPPTAPEAPVVPMPPPVDPTATHGVETAATTGTDSDDTPTGLAEPAVASPDGPDGDVASATTSSAGREATVPTSAEAPDQPDGDVASETSSSAGSESETSDRTSGDQQTESAEVAVAETAGAEVEPDPVVSDEATQEPSDAATATADADQREHADASTGSHDAAPPDAAPSDVWPGAAPVPDDGFPERDPERAPEREDAGGVPSDDDTPPA